MTGNIFHINKPTPNPPTPPRSHGGAKGPDPLWHMTQHWWREPIQPPPPLPEAGSLGFDDAEAALNMRYWLERACTDAGAKVVGAGLGCGVADIWIELEGHPFALTIKAREP